MNKDQKILSSGYKKDNVGIFLETNKQDNVLITSTHIYKAMIDLYAMRLNRRRIKLKIHTSAYVANLLRQGQCNISIILCASVLYLSQDKDGLSQIESAKQQCNDMVIKLANKEIHELLHRFLPKDKQSVLLENIGALLHYYYVIKK